MPHWTRLPYDAEVESDRELAALADPKLGQHFLVSPEKLSKLVAAAGIRPTDDVLRSEPGSELSQESFRKLEALLLLNLTSGSSGSSARTCHMRRCWKATR